MVAPANVANSIVVILPTPTAVPPNSLIQIAMFQPPLSANNDTQPATLLLPTPTPTVVVETPTTEPTRAIERGFQAPRVKIAPALGLKFATPPTLAPTFTPTPTPTLPPVVVAAGRLWSIFTPLSPEEGDHFWIGNPFEGYGANQLASPSYQFGSTANNRYRIHHGLDISNPLGTPVQAGVEGIVIHAGPDDSVLLGPYLDFYGRAVVIHLNRRLPVAGGELGVFVLYGHLSEVHATVGQHVQPTDVIGLVGMTGIAIGPHLHVETRLGDNTYQHNVNPYLWMKPKAGTGAVAIRLLTVDGRTWSGAKLSIARFENGAATWGSQIDIYMDTENIGPDPAWGENGALGNAPAGYYTVVGNINGERVKADFVVRSGETTFVEIRTQQ
jgi:murein DD-endopeptidase MepM/ murein hydrolase activator NlpD